MKPLYLLIPIYLGFALSSCTSMNETAIDKVTPQKQTKTTPPHKCPLKNPLTVSFYTKGKKPQSPYRIIGTETVSKYNVVGVKRQEAIISDTMRKIAAAMGGDAVIDVIRNEQVVTGTVVSYEKKLV